MTTSMMERSAEPIDLIRLPSGTLLAGRYRTEELLGRGSIATVLRARDELRGQSVVLKAIDPLRSKDQISKQRLRRELEVLTKVAHPGVARVLGLEVIAGSDVLVLEYVEGETLAERLLRGHLGVEEALGVTTRLCEALEACHKVGVIHRDVKPANIVLHPDRGPVLLDFGMAWFTSAMTLTRTGALVGSPRYVAPELFESGHGDERVDVFGVGAVSYEMLTGRPLRIEDTIAEIARGGRAPPSPRSLVHEIPRSVERAVLRATAARPELRTFTVAELARSLRGEVSERALETSVACPSCGSARIVDLPFCPGCGATAEWKIQPGGFAVDVLDVEDAEVAWQWLERRHGEALEGRGRSRLRRPPLPLAVGVSEASAEALVAEAARSGVRAEVVRSGAFGPPLRLPIPRPAEIFAAAAAHLSSVMAVAAAGSMLGAPAWSLRTLPFLASAALVGLWLKAMRKPVLNTASERQGIRHSAMAWIVPKLQALGSPRARGIAAGAVARAAPVLLDDVSGLPEAARSEALASLASALDAAVEVDRLAGSISSRPRGAHAVDEQGGSAELELVHDFAVRRALEAADGITRALSVRTLPSEL
ncbi:MAG: serine/threonine protein kinase [Deltaproteobacteria bacterium]|nr:serine/threonine protein kinase [Deltaproteobacteria bacterium]